jgi:hypothetical protein
MYVDVFFGTYKVDVNVPPAVQLVGNKSDLTQRVLSQEMINKWMQKNRIPLYYEVATKSGEHIEVAFSRL